MGKCRVLYFLHDSLIVLEDKRVENWIVMQFLNYLAHSENSPTLPFLELNEIVSSKKILRFVQSVFNYTRKCLF